MKISKEERDKFYVRPPKIVVPQEFGIRINYDVIEFSRALGIDTAHGSYYAGVRGSFQFIRRDIAELMTLNPMAIFSCRDEQDIRVHYLNASGEGMDGYYEDHLLAEPKYKPDGITLEKYPAYTTLLDLSDDLVINAKDRNRIGTLLKALHIQYEVPVLRSLRYFRKENHGNRLPMYRKEIVHLLLYPNVSDTIKSKLVSGQGTLFDVQQLAKQAGIYQYYPYELMHINQ